MSGFLSNALLQKLQRVGFRPLSRYEWFPISTKAVEDAVALVSVPSRGMSGFL